MTTYGSGEQSDPVDVPQERGELPVARSVDHLLVSSVRNQGMNRVHSCEFLRSSSHR